MIILGVGSCESARMLVRPGLEVDSERYAISETPKAFSGGSLVFGPYRASEVWRSGVVTKSSGASVGRVEAGRERVEQRYSYEFTGSGSWRGECVVQNSSSEVGVVQYKMSAEISCAFESAAEKSAQAGEWSFVFKGETFIDATGVIPAGSKEIKVKSTNELEGSSLKMGRPTGYYFYWGDKIVGGVDALNKEGPVWLHKSLTAAEKDMIAAVVVALLLNQTNP